MDVNEGKKGKRGTKQEKDEQQPNPAQKASGGLCLQDGQA